MITPDPPHGMDPKNRERVVDDHDRRGLRIDTGCEEELSAEELALRRLLHNAVQDIEPRPDALTHLRRAVPARRAHRRQLLVGAAAACLLAIVAVPAVIHVADTANSQSPNAANASSAHDADGTKTDNGQGDADEPAASVSGGKQNSTGKGGNPAVKPTSAAPSGAAPSSTLADTAPVCTAADLGKPIGATGTAESSGQVSGYFQVANISSGPCTIDGGGSVSFTAQGSAEGSRISVVDHTSGDGTSLPDTPGAPLILQAGQTYQVQFTWVPASGGGTTGCQTTTTPTPTPAATEDTSSGTSSSDGGTTTSLDPVSDDAGSASILLTHTPQAGGPAASTTISNACAGTIYKTGAIATT